MDIIKIITKYSEPTIFLALISTILGFYINYKNLLGLEKNERKIDILNKSLNNFYIPMQIKYGELKGKNIGKKDAAKIYSHLYVNMVKNYLYVNPLIYKYLIIFKDRLDNNRNYTYVVNNLIEHINRETLRLRKKLGYPYLNVFNALKVAEPSFILFAYLYLLLIINLTIAYLLSVLKDKISLNFYNSLSILMFLLLIFLVIYLFICVFFLIYSFFNKYRMTFKQIYKKIKSKK